MCSNFRGFVIRSSYFHVLVVGRQNRENLDLVKISRYTACQFVLLLMDESCNYKFPFFIFFFFVLYGTLGNKTSLNCSAISEFKTTYVRTLAETVEGICLKET